MTVTQQIGRTFCLCAQRLKRRVRIDFAGIAAERIEDSRTVVWTLEATGDADWVSEDVLRPRAGDVDVDVINNHGQKHRRSLEVVALGRHSPDVSCLHIGVCS